MRDRGWDQTGFTMLEMMTVLAVIAILSLLALPSYMDRIVRQQVAEALPLADLAKPAIQQAWRDGQPLPADNAAAGLPPPEKIVSPRVSAVTLQGGAIHIRFGNQAHQRLQGKLLTVRAAGVEEARIVPLAWLCAGQAVPAEMKALGDNRTNVEKKMLPLRCR